MIRLNDYLYSGHTVLSILHKYADDLKESAKESKNEVDLLHCDFLMQLIDILEQNDFLTSQSNRIKEFYKYMADCYPFLAFTLKGRIKSLLRAEEKFNGYIVDFIYDYYTEKGTYPSTEELKEKLGFFRDLIAYRIVISLPKCQLKEGEDQKERELDYLYEVANALPEFLEKQGFSVLSYDNRGKKKSCRMEEKVQDYYRDYVENPTPLGYRSLHITLYDELAGCHIEIQLRTKEMDDYAEIGPANHMDYENVQKFERTRRDAIPLGENLYFDEAYLRQVMLQSLAFEKLDVNMFAAVNNSKYNDCCGFVKGRLILPFEHLSGYQNDLI